MGTDDRLSHGAPEAITKLWAPGDVIVERGIFFEAVVYARPQTVVEHNDEVIASTVRIGTKYYGAQFQKRETAYEELAGGGLRWGTSTWNQNNVLVLVRPTDPYSVMGFWNEAGAFVGWYINLQDPLRWTPIGYDSKDHTLDLIVGEDLASWMWKDEHELVMAVDMGLYTKDEAVQIRANGEAVIELVKRGDIWWRDWRDRVPDLTAPIPSLPDGWDAL